jgi:hypothetical protein
MLTKFVNHDGLDVYINVQNIDALIPERGRPDLVRVYMSGSVDDGDYFHLDGNMDDIASLINRIIERAHTSS